MVIESLLFTTFQPAGRETEVKGHAIDVDIWKKGFYPTYTPVGLSYSQGASRFQIGITHAVDTTPMNQFCLA